MTRPLTTRGGVGRMVNMRPAKYNETNQAAIGVCIPTLTLAGRAGAINSGLNVFGKEI